MAWIRFKKSRRPIEIASGALLMPALQSAGVPVASSCRGDGVCAKCRIEIVGDRNSLSQESDLEKFLRDRYGLRPNERISCQTHVKGDITIDTSYW